MSVAERTAMLLSPPPYRSPEWHEWRTHGLGASEFPALVGADPYMTEYGLALVKRRLSEEGVDTVTTRWGKRIEGVALDAYEEVYGEITRGETWGDSRWPRLWATLDGRRGRIGVEVKASDRWRDPPPRVRIQALGQIGLADLDAVDVVRVSPFGEPQVTTLARTDEGNEQAIADLLELAEAWYQRYVVDGEMPLVDGSDAAARHLSQTMTRGEDVADANEYQAELARLALHRRQDKEAAERDERRARQLLQQSMVGLKRLDGEGFRVTWVHRNGSTSVNWEAVAKAYRQLLLSGEEPPADLTGPEALDAIESLHTSQGEPSDYVTVKAIEEAGE